MRPRVPSDRGEYRSLGRHLDPDLGSFYGRGFTLTELLVVMGIIAVVAGLLLPALTHARFRSRVTVCSNQYRQWGLAANVYATEDSKGRLPSYPLPVQNMSTYSTIEPWFVAMEMVTNLVPYGVNLPRWFCPTRSHQFQVHRENFRTLRGREMTTPADLVDEYVNVQRAAFGFGDWFWWVPRRLGISGIEFPDPNRMKTRVPDAWPRRLDDPNLSTMPMISDWTVGQWDDDRRVLSLTGGGHAWPTTWGPIKSSIAGFADGHVETRPRSALPWQVEGARSTVYVY